MNQATAISLNRIFLSWMIIGNALWLLTPDTGLSHYLGEALVWTTLMPGMCLAALNTRRSLALLLAILWLPIVAAIRLKPRLQSLELL